MFSRVFGKLIVSFLLLWISTCSSEEEECNDGDLRLWRDSNKSKKDGIVEICYNSKWGFICDDKWGINERKVACKQLGFRDINPDAITTLCPAVYYGVGEEGMIVLDDVMCHGHESELILCRHGGFGEHNCKTREAAGVHCSQRLVDIIHMASPLIPTTPSPSVPQPTILVSSSNEDAPVPTPVPTPISTSDPPPTAPSTTTPVLPTTDPYSEGSVHLVDMLNNSSGLIEVYKNGEWGSVCDDSWTDKDANVACRQLGFLGFGANATQRGVFLQDQDVTYWLDDVKCIGNEMSLFQCKHKTRHNCRSNERAGVECLARDDIDIRLVDGTIHSGYIELFYKNEWRPVCGKYWSNIDARVACRQLGFTDESNSSRVMPGKSQGNGHYWLNNVNCVGDENFLFTCKHSGIGEGFCSNNQRAGVICSVPHSIQFEDLVVSLQKDAVVTGECAQLSTNEPECFVIVEKPCVDSDVRLSGERAREGEGYVEVCMMGEWRSVCDDGWDINAAIVVCNELGMLTGASVPVRQSFDQRRDSPVHYWLDDILCVGNETSLLQCRYSLPGFHNCGPNEEAMVACYGHNTSDMPTELNTGMRLLSHNNMSHGCKNIDYAIEANAAISGNGIRGTVVFRLLSVSKNTTTYEVDVDVEGLNASELYEWGIYNHTINETETMSCGNESSIYDPFDMIERSCNYEKDCSESIENCAEGDYSGRFDKLDGSGRMRVVSNVTNLSIAELVTLSVFIYDGKEMACGQIAPVFECDDGEIVMNIVSNNQFLGPIEFCVHNKWHRVSALNWTKQDATVACKQLELNNTDAVAVAFNEAEVFPNYGQYTTKDLFNSRNETSYGSCTPHRVSRPLRRPEMVAGALCQNKYIPFNEDLI